MAHAHSVKWPDVGLRLGTWHTFPVATYERLFSDDGFLRSSLKSAVDGGEWGAVHRKSADVCREIGAFCCLCATVWREMGGAGIF